MAVLIGILIILGSVGLFIYPVYLGLYTHKDLILKRLAGVDALLQKRQVAVMRIIDMIEDSLPEQAQLIFDVKNIIFQIKKLPFKWNNNEERFKLENELDTKLGTFFDILMNTQKIYSNIYYQKEIDQFIAIQAALINAVKEFNKTLAYYKSLINSPIGQIMAPKMHISCKFVPYYIPEN